MSKLNIMNLPFEVIINICHHINLIEIYNIRLVNKIFYQVKKIRFSKYENFIVKLEQTMKIINKDYNIITIKKRIIDSKFLHHENIDERINNKMKQIKIYNSLLGSSTTDDIILIILNMWKSYPIPVINVVNYIDYISFKRIKPILYIKKYSLEYSDLHLIDDDPIILSFNDYETMYLLFADNNQGFIYKYYKNEDDLMPSNKTSNDYVLHLLYMSYDINDQYKNYISQIFDTKKEICQSIDIFLSHGSHPYCKDNWSTLSEKIFKILKKVEKNWNAKGENPSLYSY